MAAAVGDLFRKLAASGWRVRGAFLALALFSGLIAWLPGRETSASFDPGKERYVVVYYANETTAQAANSEPYRLLQTILTSSGRKVGTDLAATLAQDAPAFSASVRFKTTEFIEQAHRRKFDLAIFTNELAETHNYTFFDAGTQHLESSSFALASTPTHPFLKTAPLAQPGALRQALIDIIGRYPATPLRILLIVHSHGTLDMALMPRVSTDLGRATPQEIAAALDASVEAPVPNWARPQGTTKAEFWRVLRDIGATYANVSFPLIVRASCESGLGSWREYLAIPDNVGLIAHTGTRQMDMRSQQLDLIFGGADGHLSSSDLLPAIRRAGFDIDTKASLTAWLVPLTLWQIPVFVYFLPIILLLACCCLVRVHRRFHGKFILRQGPADSLDNRLMLPANHKSS